MNDNGAQLGLTREEAEALLKEAVRGQTTAVIGAKQLAALERLGIRFDIIEGESLDNFFYRAKAHADDMVTRLPPMPEWLEYQFKKPYYQARINLLLGLPGASITLCALLLEHMLKWAAFCVEAASEQSSNSIDHWRDVEINTNFGSAIGYAKKWGLVDKELSKKLDRFREDVRNVHGHNLVFKATEGVEVKNAAAVDFANKTVYRNQSLDAHETITMASLAKEEVDQRRALDVFLFMHSCMEHLFSTRDDLLASKNCKRPTG
jgi:hypothetical protein